MEAIVEELLLHIFQSIANDHSVHPTAISTVTHVCSRWRMIALSSGSLWTRILLTFPVRPQHISYALAFLERSANYPLDILLDFRDPAWNWDEDSHSFRWQNMEPIVRLFLAHVTRWRQFELLADTWSPIFTFLWYTRHVQSAPILETLSLSRCNLYFAARGHTFRPTFLRQPLPFFGGISLPCLRSVSLTGVHIDWEQPSLRNLTELDLKYLAHDVMPTLSQFEAMCSASPGLLRLSIFGWGLILDNSHGEASGRLRLQNLQRFSFGFLDIPYSIRLLSLFDFPSLSELMLEDISRVVSPSDLQDATSLIQAFIPGTDIRPLNTLPLPQLRVLEIHNVRCSQTAFSSFIQRAPSLMRLGLFDVADDLLSAVIPSQVIEIPCPQLQDLYCQDMDPIFLLRTILSRSLPSLRNVVLEFVRHTMPSAESPLFRRLIDAGIDIRGKSGSDTSDSSGS